MELKDLAPYAIPYPHYRFLYPPRPETKTPASNLHAFDHGKYFAQPKLNGSNIIVFMCGTTGEVKIMNRVNEPKTGNIPIDAENLYRGTGWFALNGEWMEKSKKDETGQFWNDHFVIFDILVYKGHILTGSTVENRLNLLTELYGTGERQVNASGQLTGKPYLLTTPLSNVWRVNSYESDFKALYDEITPIDMYEGVVLKNRQAKLSPPFVASSNQNWCLKSRKSTKNYNH